MSIESQTALFSSLGSLGASIPGLSPDPIIANLAEKSDEINSYITIVKDEQKENEERGMSKEQAQKEAENKVKEVINTYKATIKPMVIEQITVIKQQYKIIKDGLARIPVDVQATIANIALPPSISAPPGAPNPVYALNLARQVKNSLEGILGIMLAAFTQLIKAANMIKFSIPTSVLNTYEGIKTAATVINTIPG